MLEKAWKLLDRVFLARVPGMTFPSKTMEIPGRSSDAQRTASVRLVLESVESKPMGFWAPVRTTGFGLPWIKIAQGRRRIGHGVRAVQHHEAVIAVISLRDDLCDPLPMGGVHIG